MGTRQQKQSFNAIAPFVQEIKEHFPNMGARQLVSTLRQDYLIKVSEYVSFLLEVSISNYQQEALNPRTLITPLSLSPGELFAQPHHIPTPPSTKSQPRSRRSLNFDVTRRKLQPSTPMTNTAAGPFSTCELRQTLGSYSGSWILASVFFNNLFRFLDIGLTW